METEATMTLRKATTGMVMAIVLLIAGQAMAATTHTHTMSSKGSMSATNFAKQVAMGGMAEVEISRIATTQGSNADVKSFAQRMVDDHSKANDELKALAQQKSWTLPTDMDAKHKATLARLSKLNGAAFDRAYMKAMMTDHKQTVAMFQRYSRTGTDSDLKAWVDKTLPTIQGHESMAMTTAKTVGAASSKSMATTP
jgi:putative membrane protein